ncbi:hypothetical protein OC861_006651 [Tilletia horrida]|nr:hypothetical protein OC845_006388 [Tilletia horrida]KAK0559416.1 hypothetical protein OC861_006651 [Tilletia horrida]
MGANASIMNTDPPKVHRKLCGLRFDNAVGFASTRDGLTTTCFNDVVLEPLATWVLLLVILPALHLLVWLPYIRSGAAQAPLLRFRYGTTVSEEKGLTPRRYGGLRTAGNVLYALLIIAAFLMNILQIVRLALANRGVGLLPFNLAGILIVLFMMVVPTPAHRSARTKTSLAILFYWTMLIAFTGVAIGTMQKLNGIEDRKGTEYLLSDELIDVGVQIGLYAVFWLAEAGRQVGYATGRGTDATA